MSLNKEMGDKHEGWLVGLFGGRQSRGSGNQWRQPMDGRTSRRHLAFAFAWDGKSTMAKSMSIPLTMIRKAIEQSGGHRPMLALRWYNPEVPYALEPVEDWVAVRAVDMAEVVKDANILADLEAEIAKQAEHYDETYAGGWQSAHKRLLRLVDELREQGQ